MDKKDIYEHLAKIYLDASSNKKKKRIDPRVLKSLTLAALAVIFFSVTGLVVNLNKKLPQNSQIALYLHPEIAKINFNFQPAKKEVYAIALNSLNLSHYKSLAFSVKKNNPRDTVSLRVEFTNIFKERSYIYVKDIPSRWGEYIMRFDSFDGITDWSEMKELSFAVEEWNAREDKDVVYLENIRVLR